MHLASPRLLCLAALALALGAASVQADPISWTFDSSNSSHAVVGDLSNLGDVTLTTMTGSFSGDQTVPILAVVASTSPIGDHIDSYNGAAFSVVVDLKDALSGDVGEFSFTGHLSGSVNPTTASLSSTLDAFTTMHHPLGGHDYAVTIGSFVSPLSPTVNGEIDVAVTIDGEVTQPAPPPHANDSPEPSSAVLGALGLGATCVALRRNRRAAMRGA
jgi:hypothetical protein